MTLRLPTQVRTDLPRPTRIWARNVRDLGDDPHVHSCALLYLSDVSSGLSLVPGSRTDIRIPTVDHSMWFYRPARADDWVLLDLAAESTSAGRGVYSGRIFARDGRLVAGLNQESLYRNPR